ncbi:hypothetical protein EUTSA_v10029498mg [Eutrema salsugineum]|uniref:Uncharacterized protein n=1 Tax=Eutrema salsugineum TaxID=72664 RepID=V4KL48_EUTSA|nr:hypothetical protein EUTSA_v10029498mg [Eutrema salsugineum]
MVLLPGGDYESQDEQDNEPDDSGEDVEYPDTRELLVTRRVLTVHINPKEKLQRENLFHTRCTIRGKVCNFVHLHDSSLCTYSFVCVKPSPETSWLNTLYHKMQ